MPWDEAGGQNIEHPHSLAILSSFFFFFFFFCFNCILVLLARHSSGELRCSVTVLITLSVMAKFKFPVLYDYAKWRI